MFGNMFGNMPNVVKNLLIINVLLFLATVVLANRDIDLHMLLGLHYPDSDNFRPYQLATHFFMHLDFRHIFFNCIGLVVFGSHLERVWGPKRFLTFYFVTALGAALLHMVVQGFELYHATGTFFPVADGIFGIDGNSIYPLNQTGLLHMDAAVNSYGPSMGASGALYGLLMAFAMLFPNTEFMLLFPPIPIKAKWLALILGGVALYSGYMGDQVSMGHGSVAHFAHLGGMLFGFIVIKIWQRDQSNFY